MVRLRKCPKGAPLAVFIFRLYTPTVIGRAIKITPDRGDRALKMMVLSCVTVEKLFVL